MFSLDNGGLQTTTDNFDFHYINEDSLKRIIDNVRQANETENTSGRPRSGPMGTRSSAKHAPGVHEPLPVAVIGDDLNLELEQSTDDEVEYAIEPKNRPQRSLHTATAADAAPGNVTGRTDATHYLDEYKEASTTGNTARGRLSLQRSSYSDRILLTKITTYQQSVRYIVVEILDKLQKQRWHNGTVDLNRRGKCFSAFLALFNRNFFYRIKRLTIDIQNAPTIGPNYGRKVSTLYAAIYQAAVLYLRHIDNFVLDGLPEKLLSFLGLIKEATDACIENKFFDRDDAVSQALITAIDDTVFHLENNVAHSKCKLLQVKQGVRAQNRPKPKANRKSATSPSKLEKLSMYRSPLPPKTKTKQEHTHSSVKQPSLQSIGLLEIDGADGLDGSVVSDCSDNDSLLSVRRDFYEAAVAKLDMIKNYRQSRMVQIANGNQYGHDGPASCQ